MKKYKILHITDMHLRHNGRLFYSTGKKINNGLILNGHNVLQMSDRDITNQTKNIFDIGGKKYLFNGDTTYSSTKKFQVSTGKFIIKNIIFSFRSVLIIYLGSSA